MKKLIGLAGMAPLPQMCTVLARHLHVLTVLSPKPDISGACIDYPPNMVQGREYCTS